MIKCVSDGKCGQMQAEGFALLGGLQHVLSGQRGCGLVTQGKGILQERYDLSFGLQALRTVSAHEVRRELIAGKRRPYCIVGSSNMLDLQSKRAHTPVAGAWDV